MQSHLGQQATFCEAQATFHLTSRRWQRTQWGREKTMPTIEIPGWLEACRPDDDLYADAYEGTAAELRALLKTAIAFTFHRWGLHDGESRSERVSPRAGFRHCEAARPAPWAGRARVTGDGHLSFNEGLRVVFGRRAFGEKHVPVHAGEAG
jgi:hypothetical protein